MNTESLAKMTPQLVTPTTIDSKIIDISPEDEVSPEHGTFRICVGNGVNHYHILVSAREMGLLMEQYELQTYKALVGAAVEALYQDGRLVEIKAKP